MILGGASQSQKAVTSIAVTAPSEPLKHSVSTPFARLLCSGCWQLALLPGRNRPQKPRAGRDIQSADRKLSEGVEQRGSGSKASCQQPEQSRRANGVDTLCFNGSDGGGYSNTCDRLLA